MAKAVSREPDPTVAALPTWEMDNAKSRFGEIARLAHERGPQRVTVQGQDAVVVLSAADYARLAPVAAKPTLFALFADSPFADFKNFDEQLLREKASARDVPDFDQ